MQKQIKAICVLGALLVGCSLSLTSRAQAAESVQDNAKKDWTMLVYLNGNNNLDDFGAMNIKQMQQVGSTDHLNVVVQWASMAANDTKRLYIQKDPTATTVTSPVVQSLPVVDMGSKDTLLDFIKWGVQTYPADHYFIAVWDHGAGWHFQMQGVYSLNGRFKPTDISFDERSGNHITTEELGQVIDQAAALIGHKVDIYGSDACLMAMVEVAQQMGNSVETFVGSEETEPGDGWPYHIFLKSWTDNPNATSRDIGKYLVDAYHQYYTAAGNTSTTFSAIDMSQLPAMVSSLADLKTALVNRTDFAAIKTAASNAGRYTYSDYVDIQDVVAGLQKGLDAKDAAQPALAAVSTQLAKTVIAAGTTGMVSNGLSIWWPTESYDWTSYGTRYKGLLFDQLSHWDELLQKLF